MKRKIFNIFLTIIAALALAFSLASCEKESENIGQEQTPPTEELNPDGSGDESDEKEEADTVGLEYKEIIKDGEIVAYTVSGIGTEKGDNLIIPSTHRGKRVTGIDDSAFACHESLTGITVPDGVISIGENAFYNCTNLSDIIIPNSVKSIGSSAFEGTAYYNDESNWDNDLLYISNHLIVAKASIQGISEIKDGTLTIADWAFMNCRTLNGLIIPSSVESIGGNAFSECSRLMGVMMGNGVKTIGESAFYKCGNLTSINLPDGLKSICSRTFYECGNLTSVTIGNGVTEIEAMAFYGCGNLTDLTIPDGVAKIGGAAFSQCSSLKNITVSEGNKVFYSSGNCIIETDGKRLILGCKGSEIPTDGSVTSIANYAFEGCVGLKTITIPESVKSIGDGAFQYCYNLTDVTVGDGVTSIGDYAFAHCNSLTDLNLPDGVKSIGEYVFSNCSSLLSLTIPDGVKNIGDGTLLGCNNLTSITIPDSVKSLNDSALCYCESLTDIYFGGTKAQWEQVKKGYDWDYGTGDFTVYCTDGDLKK